MLLARALVASSKMLFLDEPVTGLDNKVTADFIDAAREKGYEFGKYPLSAN